MKTALKSLLKNILVTIPSKLNVSSKYFGTPRGWVNTADWVSKNARLSGVTYTEVIPSKKNNHQLPVTLDKNIHNIYLSNRSWQQPPAFVAGIPNGRVWGRNGAVITPDDLLLGDVSREFGKYGGVFNEEHSIFKQIKLARVSKVEGVVAVVAAPGSYNYHHWLYDTLPRLGLLKKAGLFEKIDYFVIDYTGLPFQKESLALLGVDLQKVIASNDHWNFHIEADLLFVPSLPAKLGTICDWTVEFLRNTFLSDTVNKPEGRKNIYISRKKAPTRKLLNEQELIEQVLAPLDFAEFFAEDHSIRETALAFAGASYIVGVHGSGFANLVFCSPGTKVIDIVAPRHIDAYYWFLANYNDSTYGYIYGTGDRAGEEDDLVKNKVDLDIKLDLPAFSVLLQAMQITQNEQL